MKPLTKAIAVALIQVLLVCSLGAKLLYDRRTRPRAWFRTQRYDPNLPIRGRYVSLQIELKDPRSPEEIENKFRGEIQMMESRDARYNYRGTYDFGRECGSIDLRKIRPWPGSTKGSRNGIVTIWPSFAGKLGPKPDCD